MAAVPWLDSLDSVVKPGLDLGAKPLFMVNLMVPSDILNEPEITCAV